MHRGPFQKTWGAGLAGIINDTPQSVLWKMFFNVFKSFVHIFLICDVHLNDVKSSRIIANSFEPVSPVTCCVDTSRKDGESHGMQFL